MRVSASVPNVVVSVKVPPVKVNLYQTSLIAAPAPTPQEGLVPSVTVFKFVEATNPAFGINSMALVQMSFEGTCERA